MQSVAIPIHFNNPNSHKIERIRNLNMKVIRQDLARKTLVFLTAGSQKT